MSEKNVGKFKLVDRMIYCDGMELNPHNHEHAPLLQEFQEMVDTATADTLVKLGKGLQNAYYEFKEKFGTCNSVLNNQSEGSILDAYLGKMDNVDGTLDGFGLKNSLGHQTKKDKIQILEIQINALLMKFAKKEEVDEDEIWKLLRKHQQLAGGFFIEDLNILSDVVYRTGSMFN